MGGTLFTRARIFTPRDEGRPLAGPEQNELSVYEDGALLVEGGLIRAVGGEDDVRRRARGDEREIDCLHSVMVPGFVDPHTHMCFAALREREFIQRIGGAEYLDILKQGGGILSSVRAVRAADEDLLFEVTQKNICAAAAHGATTVEIKSGYGLDTETELKMLRVIDRAGRSSGPDVAATFLGAHAVPEDFRDDPDRYVDLVIGEMLPAVAEQGLAEFCDVFCERGVFSPEQARRILQAGLRHGLKPKLHADEVHDLGGGALAAELRAVSADHLLAEGRAGLEAMAASGTVAVLLPGTAYSLRKAFAPARSMIELGVPVALATDCNPGSSYVQSMPFVIGLAVMNMRMSPEEALTAATLNAAYAMDRADRAGSLEPGKQADFCLIEGETPAMLAYRAGVNPVRAVYKRGILIAENGRCVT